MAEEPAQKKRSFAATLEDDDDPDGVRKTMDAHWETFSATMQRGARPGSTIEPMLRHDSRGAAALRDLPSRGLDSILTFERTLGEGGMGVVRLAKQHSMGRNVAVKTLRADLRSDEAQLRLLREAWITGALEHPNVVPVYDVTMDEHGRPTILLKNIEGQAWSVLMGDEEAMRGRLGQRDRLESNLRVFVQVCNAIALAHERRILHRDIKPENVMIGTHGEVYVVDWGIAVCLDADPTGRLPTVNDVTEMAGTPCYMAPEMVAPQGGRALSVRTDIYLLGAVLYELLAGRAPHEFPDFRVVLQSIFESEPRFATEVDEELRGITVRCMRKDPAERYESVLALRKDIELFLVHRESRRLTDEAMGRLVELEGLLAERAGGEELEQKARVHAVYGACRFGFAQALAEWPGNARALEGQARALSIVVEFLLSRGDAQAAGALLAEFDDAPPDLSSRVSSAERAEKLARSEAALILDTDTGRRTRLFMSAVLGVLWTAAPLMHLGMGYDYQSVAIGFGIEIASFVVFVVWARDSLSRTPFNRKVVSVIFTVLLGSLVFLFSCAHLGISVHVAAIQLSVIWVLTSALAALMMPIPIWPSVGFSSLMVLLRFRWPQWGGFFLAASNLFFVANIAYVWDGLRALREIHAKRANKAHEAMKQSRG
jgi:eukaryotic-like serine/threonine-protein kinase